MKQTSLIPVVYMNHWKKISWTTDTCSVQYWCKEKGVTRLKLASLHPGCWVLQTNWLESLSQTGCTAAPTITRRTSCSTGRTALPDRQDQRHITPLTLKKHIFYFSLFISSVTWTEHTVEVYHFLFLPCCISCYFLSVPKTLAWECHRLSSCLRKHGLSSTSDPDWRAFAPSGCLFLINTQISSTALSRRETQDVINIINRNALFCHAWGTKQSTVWEHAKLSHVYLTCTQKPKSNDCVTTKATCKGNIKSVSRRWDDFVTVCSI